MRTGRAVDLALRGVGWVSVAAGAVVGLYLVYSLLFTNLQTQRTQDVIAQRWEREVSDVEEPWELEVGAPPEAGAAVPTAGRSASSAAPPPPPPVVPGEAVAVLEFARGGTGEPVVRQEPLFVIEGVGVDDLRSGPGHYPASELPGQPGNFAVAGHRSTYDAPFYNVDQLASGDEVRVTDRAGNRFTYRVVEQRIVGPREDSVLEEDPLGTGRPTLTLTTCHPRFSNAQRLVVFAELVA